MNIARITSIKYIVKTCRDSKGIFCFLNNLITRIAIHDLRIARFVINFIPSNCPFERDIQFCGHTLFHIPPLCKLNPLYESLMVLRFRAMTYLSELGEY